MPLSAVETPSMPVSPRASESLSTVTLSDVKVIPRRAARMAIAVAVQEAIEARSSQLGFGPTPSPPMAVSISVITVSPWGPVTSHRSPFCHVALAGGFDFLAAAGRSRNTRCNLSKESRTREFDIVLHTYLFVRRMSLTSFPQRPRILPVSTSALQSDRP